MFFLSDRYRHKYTSLRRPEQREKQEASCFLSRHQVSSTTQGWFGAWSLPFTGCSRSFQPGASGEVRAATSLNGSGDGGSEGWV